MVLPKKIRGIEFSESEKESERAFAILKYLLSVIPDLLKPIITGTADYTKGNRLVNNEYSKGMSKWRLFGNKILFKNYTNE